MQIPNQGPVIVGVGRTPAGSAAVRLAAREAGSRGRALLVVHAFDGPGDAGYGPARRAASRLVDEAVATAQRSTPGVDARGQLVDGPPERVLIGLSRGAVLTVVGGAMTELVARAWCPVAVTRAHRTPTGPVVAAVDGSPASVLALRFAVEAAGRRGGPVHLLHVTDPDREADGERVLDEVLAQVPEATAVRRRILLGEPVSALITASRRAGLLVLGPRAAASAGRLGTVAAGVLRHGACPAVFVHGTRLPNQRVPPRTGRTGRFQEAR